MPDLLAPGERLAGPPADRRALAAWLTALRADPPAPPPGLAVVTLAELMAAPGPHADPDLLRAGIAAARRYRELGLPGLLPPHRVYVGISSADPQAWGGFHYPGQGYRHWQMTAIITRPGPLNQPADPRAAALDLLRAYAHDSLHYGSHRVYQAHPAPAGYGIARTRYGINFRRTDGRTYSRPDPPDAITTRNLGTIMEAATDREATAITRTTAHAAAVPEPPGSGICALAYRDATGTLTPADLAGGQDQPGPRDTSPAAYRTRATRYHHAITAPYAALLDELSPANPAALHDLIVTAMVTGTLAPLARTLNEAHGPAAFTRLFKNHDYTRPTPR